MRKSVRSIGRRGALLALSIVGMAGFTPSAGLAVTTYAAVTGNNGNACTTASAPCATISAALTKAASGGSFPLVIVLGPGIFSEAVNVTSATGAEIVGDGNGFVAISPPGGGIGINVAVGTGAMFVGNLQILGSSSSATVGIKVVTAAKVNIENVEIRGFMSAAIDSEVSTGPYPSMTVSNSVLGDGGCFVAHPQGSANLSVLIENTRIRNCASTGVKVDTSATAGGSASAILKNSSIEAAQVGLGVYSLSNTGYAMGTLENSISENTTDGVIAKGTKSVVYLNKASIMNNHTAVVNSGGQVNSYGNNSINWNATANVGTVTPVSLQ